ncbi:hypothetical protein LTR64_003527 [Lithohypha guttulata]|uniref:uncharacterized protein n=1 Tax=Lithohypha guttulata TaxID=1690604 RepID=UPI00315DB780
MTSPTPSSDDVQPRRSRARRSCPQSAGVHETPSPSSNLPTSPPYRSGSKREHAVQLAQELASSGPWAEALMSRSYGTQDSLTIASSLWGTAHLAGSNQANERNNTYMTCHELDPPPAYCRLPETHELPASQPSILSIDNDEAAERVPADSEQAQHHEEQASDPEQPLLEHARPWQRKSRGWTPWIHQGKDRARRWVRLLCLVFLFSFVAMLLACLLYGYSRHQNNWSKLPARPSMSAVPIGPSYERHETTDSITGKYELHDRLELSTTTGTIDIEIDLQQGREPAFLSLTSLTGAISLRVAPSFVHRQAIPSRAIYTELRTLTGTVTAEILLGDGACASVSTVTGLQDITILAYDMGPNDPISNLTTDSRTGEQKVRLTSLGSSYETITNIRAHHRVAGTAAMNIVYPSNWYGEVYALTSPLGNIEMQGGELRYLQNNNGEKLAYRGRERSGQMVEIISIGTGSVKFIC